MCTRPRRSFSSIHLVGCCSWSGEEDVCVFVSFTRIWIHALSPWLFLCVLVSSLWTMDCSCCWIVQRRIGIQSENPSAWRVWTFALGWFLADVDSRSKWQRGLMSLQFQTHPGPGAPLLGCQCESPKEIVLVLMTVRVRPSRELFVFIQTLLCVIIVVKDEDLWAFWLMTFLWCQPCVSAKTARSWAWECSHCEAGSFVELPCSQLLWFFPSTFSPSRFWYSIIFFYILDQEVLLFLILWKILYLSEQDGGKGKQITLIKNYGGLKKTLVNNLPCRL